MIITWTEFRDQDNKITSVEIHTLFGGRKKIDITKPVTIVRSGCYERITQESDKEVGNE